MADSNADGRTRVTIAASIANIAAPTVAELNAGIPVEGLMTPDGLVGFEPSTADVDNSKLNSTFSTVAAGRISFSGTLLRLIKQTGTDTVYNTLTYAFPAYVVIRRDVTSSTAWTIGQAVEVYPVQFGEAADLTPEANSVHKYEAPIKITAQPNRRATVA